MDVGGVETTTFTARGGVDLITVHDLTGSGVGQVVIDLEGTPGSGTGDSANDVVTLEGTNGNDAIVLSLQNGNLVVDGLASQIVIEHFELGDQIRIFGLDGDDVINASGIPAGLVSLVLDGGNGDDFLIGSSGDDTLLGAAGDDILFGGPGLDVLDGGPGANVVVQDSPEPIVFDTDPYAAAPVEHALLIG
jgi:Ca2+-binding RTX toxin-like protein